MKGLPPLDLAMVKQYFGRNDAYVIDEKEKLTETVNTIITNQQKPVFLLLMSSGTFDGIDWNISTGGAASVDRKNRK